MGTKVVKKMQVLAAIAGVDKSFVSKKILVWAGLAGFVSLEKIKSVGG